MTCSTKKVKLMEDISKTTRTRKKEIKRKRKGCPWNPLNLLTVGGFRGGKDINGNEREELQRRVKQIEQRLCYITDKIDQCEQSKLEEDSDEGAETNKEDVEADSEEKNACAKSSQNFMILLKQQKMKNRFKDPGKFCTDKGTNKEASEKKRKTSAGESKSVVWNTMPCLESDYDTLNKTNLVNKSEQLKPSNQGQTTVTNTDNNLKQQCVSQNGDEMNKGTRILSNEPVTKKNIKTIIDEAVVDSIGKTLQKYFKEGLENYIKSRVESAVHLYNDVDTITCYTPRTQTSFSSRPKSRTKESIVEELRNYQSSMKATEEALSDVAIACSVKTLCSGKMTNITVDSFDQSGLQKNNTKLKCKYSDIRSWVNKRQRHKPVSAPSGIKSVVSICGTESNKTIQVLKGNAMKPYPYERPFPRRFVRRNFSKDNIS